jgi:hypothetical protein
MVMFEKITKSEREIAERAIDILKKHKNLLFSILDWLADPPLPYAIYLIDIPTGMSYCFHFDYKLFDEQRMPGESKTLPFDDVVALRLAKLIFENYKAAKQKELNDAIDNTLNSSTNKTISAIKSGSLTYDIGVNGKSLTTTVSEVEELKDKVRELTDLNEILTQKLNGLEAILQSKGVL